MLRCGKKLFYPMSFKSIAVRQNLLRRFAAKTVGVADTTTRRSRISPTAGGFHFPQSGKFHSAKLNITPIESSLFSAFAKTFAFCFSARSFTI